MSTVTPTELNDVFRANMKARRKALGLTQQQLAEVMSTKKERVFGPYICDIEKGVKMPGLAMLARLADALQTTPQELISTKAEISA